jgi:hypothetical protein
MEKRSSVTVRKSGRGGKRPGAGRKPGTKDSLPRGTAHNIQHIVKIFKKYGIPGTEQDPVAYLKSRGIANPIDVACLEERLAMVTSASMPRNAVAKSAILRDLEARAGARDGHKIGEMSLVGLILGAEKIDKEES